MHLWLAKAPNSLVGNFSEFLESFGARNLADDRELAELVAKADKLSAGVDSDALRSNDTLRDTAPAVGDGTIYVGDEDSGGLVAINPDGTQKWKLTEPSGNEGSSPAMGAEGTIYICCRDAPGSAVTHSNR